MLFGDVVGSTLLGERFDVETFGSVMQRYFDMTLQVVTAHGGAVEKNIGDAVFAVFGLSAVREDDAHRAVSAAVHIQRGLVELNEDLQANYDCRLDVRIAVNSGVIVVREHAFHQPLLSGDVANVAARLQSKAEPGQVLITDRTRRLLPPSLDTEELGSLDLDGRDESLAAHVVVYGDGDFPAPDTEASPAETFVGRDHELSALVDAYEDCVANNRWEVLVLEGEAGIGKSRLVERFLRNLPDDALTFVGRCRPEGAGQTLAPLIDVVLGLTGDQPRTRRDLSHLVMEILGADDDLNAITRSLGSLLGIDDAPTTSAEMAWSIRNLVESLATGQPVVLVIDDLHLARRQVVEIMEHVVLKAGPVPVLLLAVTRPGPNVGDGSFPNDDMVRADCRWLALGPMPANETELLLASAEPAFNRDFVDQVVAGAGGVPLFVKQLLPLLSEGEILVPESIEAVVHARLDELSEPEAFVLDRASVIGEYIKRESLRVMVEAERPGERFDDVIDSLLATGLLCEPTSEEGGATLAFCHAQVCTVVYERLSKHDRADLHRRYGDQLDTGIGSTQGLDHEMVGYHYETAHHYRRELISSAASSTVLATQAADRYRLAAVTALNKSDLAGAARLLSQACNLLGDPEQLSVKPMLGAVLGEAGDLRQALELLDQHVVEANERGEKTLATLGLIESMIIRMQSDPNGVSRRFVRLEPDFVSVLERSSESAGLSRFWHLKALVHWHEVHCDHAANAWRLAAGHARHVADDRRLADALSWQASAAYYGSMPSHEGIELCQGIIDQLAEDRLAHSQVQLSKACLHAMRGEHDVARFLVRESDQTLEVIGNHLHAGAPHREAFVAIMAGDLFDARSRLTWGIEHLHGIGDRALLSTNAAILAHVLILEGNHEGAMAQTALSERAVDEDDVATHICLQTAQAKCRAANGEYAVAISLARTAVDKARQTDCLVALGDALEVLAMVLRQAGRLSDAEALFLEAGDVYEEKGHLLGAQACRREALG